MNSNNNNVEDGKHDDDDNNSNYDRGGRSTGRELALISGHSGTGKTSLGMTLRKIVEKSNGGRGSGNGENATNNNNKAVPEFDNNTQADKLYGGSSTAILRTTGREYSNNNKKVLHLRNKKPKKNTN